MATIANLKSPTGVVYIVLVCECPPECHGFPETKIRWTRRIDNQVISDNEGVVTIWNYDLSTDGEKFVCVPYNDLGDGEEAVVLVPAETGWYL